MSGEVDALELVPPDNVASLRADPDVKVGTGGAYQASLIVNQLHPPFNNAKARKAVLYAVNQEKFMAGMGYAKEERKHVVWGKSWSVRVDRGVRRIIQKKKQTN